MNKKDIFGLLRFDVERKKPKKNLDDFLIGDEDQHEQVKKKKKADESKKNPLEVAIGGSLADTEASRPYINKLDWSQLNKMSHQEQAKTLRREYLTLLEKVEELSDKIVSEQSGKSEKSIIAEKYKKEVAHVREFIREIVGYIPDAYDLKMQMDTTAWELNDIKDEIQQKMKSLINKIKFVEKAMEDEMRDVNAQKKFLENELSRARERIKYLEESGSQSADGYDIDNQQQYEEEGAPVENEKTELTSPFEQVTPNKPRNEQTQVKPKNPFDNKNEPASKPQSEVRKPTPPPISDEMPKYLFIEVERYIENLPDESRFVLEIIGKTGVSRNAELKTVVEEMEEGRKFFFPGGKYNNAALNDAVKLLKDRQFLNSTNVKLGSKGGYDFQAYELTDIGKAIYYKFTNEQPVEPEMAHVMREHKTLEHGYLIKEVALSLRTVGYTVHEDRESCTYKLKDGKRQVFDLIAEKDGEKLHIEVERGTHNDVDFMEKMDKFLQVTNEMYFVAPNKESLYQVTKGKVFKWITERLGGFENARGKMKLRFATFENIKKNVKDPWEKFEP